MLLAFPLHLTRIIINYFDFFGSTANFHIFGGLRMDLFLFGMCTIELSSLISACRCLFHLRIHAYSGCF